MPRLSAFGTLSARNFGDAPPFVSQSTIAVADIASFGRYFGYIRPGSFAATNWSGSGGGVSNQPIADLTLDAFFLDNVTGIVNITFNNDVTSYLNNAFVHHVTITLPGGSPITYVFSDVWLTFGTSTLGQISPYGGSPFVAGTTIQIQFILG